MDDPGAANLTTSSDALAPAEMLPMALPSTAAPSDRARSEPDRQRPFQDMPFWIWKLFFASWLALFATLVVVFGVSANVRFVLGVVAAFAAVFLCTPLMLLRMTRRTRTRNLRRHVDILGGRCSDVEVAVQAVLLPVSLTVGLIAIGAMMPS